MTLEVEKRYEFEPLGLPAEWPPLDYRRDDSTLYENINITTIIGVPPSSTVTDVVPPVIITSANVLSVEIANATGGEWGVAAGWPSANRAYVIPFSVSESYTVKKLGWVNGATVSGNVDVGIYDSTLTKLVSAGSTAQGTISVVQEVDIADTVLAAGDYYMAMAMDNTTGRVLRAATNLNDLAGAGVAQMASAFPLPTTFVLAQPASTYAPFISVSSRTLLA